jgi:DNA-binding GntR family transcriptional regulator
MQKLRMIPPASGLAGKVDRADSSDPDESQALQGIISKARVQYLTVGEMVYGIIWQAIVSGAVKPGQHLRQDSLAGAIGVSRLPVRSALLQLEAEGLVTLHPHRGFTVRELTPEQIREIYEIRYVLESHALHQVVGSFAADHLKRLDQLARELDEADSGEVFAELSLAFYRELYDAGQHPLLVSLIERLHSDVGRYWLSKRLVNRHQSAHVRLLRYVRVGDADAACAWLKAHLAAVANELVSLVDSKEA